MKLQEIFNHLMGSEFSQLSIGGQAAGTINESNYVRVVGHINLALTALYRRFNLREGRLTLEMQEGQEVYLLNSNFAVTSTKSQEPVRYIKDSAGAKFEDDILKVERVLDEAGCDLPLNKEGNPTSLTTPSALKLRVPSCYDTQDLTVIYRANHPKIVVGMGFFDPNRVSLELPDAYTEPLLYYVASRVNNPVGMTNEFHAGNSYFAKYEAACQELEGRGLEVDEDYQENKIRRGGWV